jgi:hypothetical protein
MQFTKSVLLLTTLLSANAMADSMIGSQPTVIAPVIETVPNGTVIPMLDMHFNCGTCEQDNKIKALVEGAYLDQLDRAECHTFSFTWQSTLLYWCTSWSRQYNWQHQL